MNSTRESTSARPIEGNLLRLGERREIAIYLRDGIAWVAEFNNGRAALHAPGAWYSTASGRTLIQAQRRDAVETVSPIPAGAVQRIESLHRRMEEPVAGPYALKGFAALVTWLRRWFAKPALARSSPVSRRPRLYRHEAAQSLHCLPGAYRGISLVERKAP